MPDQNWDDLRIFLAAARAGGYAAAGRALRVDETTVARRVARIEARSGARLVERMAGKLRLTEAGAKLLARAEVAERSILAATEDLGAGDKALAGPVRLTTVPMLAHRCLAPAVPCLIEDHPGLSLELVAEPQMLSLSKRQADMALRLARPAGGGDLLTRKLGAIGFSVFAPADRDPANLPWISYEDRFRDLPQAAWIRTQPETPRLWVSDAETALALVEAGAGKSLLPDPVAARTDGLQRIGKTACLIRELWLVTHPDLARLPRFRLVSGWIHETVSTWSAGST